MTYLVALIVAVVATVVAYAMLNKDVAERIVFLAPKSNTEKCPSKVVSTLFVRLTCVVIACFCFIVTLKLVADVPDWLGVSKMVLALLCLVGAACVDYREHRIPNLYPAIMAFGGMVLLVLGVITRQNGAIAYVTTSVMAAVCCAVFLFLASFLSRQGVGAGDIKLVTALALIIGMFAVVGTLVFGIIICCLVAAGCLLSGRKKITDSLPFGPFLFLGFVATVLIGCY